VSRFTGQTVLITGASRGIGAAAVQAFAAAGARVYAMARDAAALADLVQQTGCVAITGDVADRAAVFDAVQQAVNDTGRLDVLINNAGVITPIAAMADADADAWSASIDINLKGVFWGMQAALPVMLGQGGGAILTVSSGAAHNPLEGWSAYCAGKAGVHMLTRSLDLEYRAQGIRAIGLSPGTVATQMQKDIKASGINPISQLNWDDHIPADWPARALLWMAGSAGQDWLGQEISLRDPDIRKQVGLI
jgi:NAD(P)-dependent dehydrogenase (short-subunit alcohol dehydrogenase family)